MEHLMLCIMDFLLCPDKRWRPWCSLLKVVQSTSWGDFTGTYRLPPRCSVCTRQVLFIVGDTKILGLLFFVFVKSYEVEISVKW